MLLDSLTRCAGCIIDCCRTSAVRGSSAGWERAFWRLGRERKRQPHVPSLGAVLSGELGVALQIDVALHAASWKQVSDLRSDGGDARLEVTKDERLTAVGGELLVVVADKPDVKVLPQKL